MSLVHFWKSYMYKEAESLKHTDLLCMEEAEPIAEPASERDMV